MPFLSVRRPMPPHAWAAVTLFIACGTPAGNTLEPDAGSVELLERRSSLARQAAVPSAELGVSADLERFAWSFSTELGQADENFVYSPYSIALACAMLSAGAEGGTLAGIQTALHLSTLGEPLHEGYNALTAQLEARTWEDPISPRPQILRVTNDFWAASELRPSDAFLDTLALYYGAGVHAAPFSSAPEASRQAINARIGEETAGLIPELLPQGSVDRSVKFVLTSSLYFKAFWLKEFTPRYTRLAPFHGLGGNELSVHTMHDTRQTGYLEGDGFFALSLPYRRSELEIVFVVPTGDFLGFLQGFGAEQASAIVSGLQLTLVDLALPKFDITYQAGLASALSGAGMAPAFDRARAEFDPIGAGVFVRQVFHQVRFVLDERGTEAATSTGIGGGAGPEPPVPVALDRPFLFFIRDVQTGAVLFLGHVVAP